MGGSFARDLRTAWRGLSSATGLSLAAAVSLAIGIGANLTAFALLRAIEFPILPYPDGERLVQIDASNDARQARGFPLSLPDYQDVRARASVFADLGVTVDREMTLEDGAEPVRLSMKAASASYFTTLALPAETGRPFVPADAAAGVENLVVLSHRVWSERYARDPQVLGRVVRLDGGPFTITGVMPARFDENVDAWIPLPAAAAAPRDDRRYVVVARLRSDAGLDRARSELDSLARTLAHEHPTTNSQWAMSPTPLDRLRSRESGGGYYQLQAAVMVLLLAVCANVANLLLARGVSRRREMAVRSALGASRSQLARLVLLEGLLLALVAGALGVLLSLWGVVGAAALGQFPSSIHVPFDAGTLAAALACSLVAGALVACLPALDAARSGVGQLMNDASVRGTTASRRQVWVRGLLVTAEIASALVLVTGATLMARSLWNRQNRDLGFDPRHALRAELTLERSSSDAAVRDAVRRVTEALGPGSGVQAIGFASYPIANRLGATIPLHLAGSPEDALGESSPRSVQSITPGYVAALGVRLQTGRLFSTGDRAGAAPVAIVNEELARRAWPGRDPIGQQISVGGAGVEATAAGRSASQVLTVVGVCHNVLRSAMHERVMPALYLPFDQFPGREVTAVVRSTAAPQMVMAAFRRAVFEVEPRLVVDNVQTLEADWAAFLRPTRFYATLLVIFAALALTLAAIGVFASTAYSVSQRTRELGIRLALGADAGALVRLVLRQGFRLAVFGIAAGAPLSLLAGRVLDGLLYGVEPTDWLTLVGTTCLLLGVVMVACYLPARRTAVLDPVVALRVG